jgi:hypothetical protein
MADGSYKGYTPPDLNKNNSDAANAASNSSSESYDKIIRLPLVKNKKYTFWFTYLFEDAETKEITEGPRSASVQHTFDIPNLTKPVLNLTLTPSYRAYGVKFDIDPLSVQEDIVIFESLTGTFTGEEYIVYVGTSTNVTIQTGSTAPRWVKVTVRDKWDDSNRSSVTAGPVTPLNPDPDTTFTVENPASTTATASIDPKDLSGFSVVSSLTWAVSTNTKTAGYAIRWSTTNPNTGTPLWEYASVDGRTNNTFVATGLIPNTLYYYQVAAVTPYDVVNWTGAASGTFQAQDADGTAAGALARLKSFIAIGGASQDLFKIGTGISQSINLNTVPLTNPSLTSGTYHGIILNKSTTNVGNNFWLTTGQFRVGNPTEFLYWNGTDLYLTGNVDATGGKFTGNVQLAVPSGGTSSGTLYAGSSPTSGARVRFNDSGIFAYDGIATDATVAITTAGLLDARKGFIGGWTISGTSQTVGSISKSGTILDSNGNITLGDTTGTLASIVRLSSNDATWRLWVGSQTGSNAAFRVDKTGKMYATGADISGNVVITGGSTLTAINAKKSIFTGTSATATAVGDLWFDTANNNRPKVWNGASWVDYRDSGITTAVNDAATALTTATGKNKTFVSGTAPTNGTGANALRTGDMWIDTANGNILKAWNGSSWNAYQDSSIATINTSLSTKLKASAYVIANASNEITGISGNGINIWSGASNASNTGPATSGSRITLNSQGFQAYDTSGNPTVSILTGTGSASFSGNIAAKSGTIGGFSIGAIEGDLRASTNPDTGVLPRIIFGDKVYLGWVSGDNYVFRIGNPYSERVRSFRIQTITNVNRIAVDVANASDLDYAAEIRNIVRAVGFRHMGDGFVSDSSRRYKENITEVPKHYYERILDVPINFYTYKTDTDEIAHEMKGTHSFGPIAEDIDASGLGYFVQRDLTGQITSFRNEQKYPYLLIPIVRDLKLKVEEMEARILELENS